MPIIPSNSKTNMQFKKGENSKLRNTRNQFSRTFSEHYKEIFPINESFCLSNAVRSSDIHILPMGSIFNSKKESIYYLDDANSKKVSQLNLFECKDWEILSRMADLVLKPKLNKLISTYNINMNEYIRWSRLRSRDASNQNRNCSISEVEQETAFEYLVNLEKRDIKGGFKFECGDHFDHTTTSLPSPSKFLKSSNQSAKSPQYLDSQHQEQFQSEKLLTISIESNQRNIDPLVTETQSASAHTITFSFNEKEADKSILFDTQPFITLPSEEFTNLSLLEYQEQNQIDQISKSNMLAHSLKLERLESSNAPSESSQIVNDNNNLTPTKQNVVGSVNICKETGIAAQWKQVTESFAASQANIPIDIEVENDSGMSLLNHTTGKPILIPKDSHYISQNVIQRNSFRNSLDKNSLSPIHVRRGFSCPHSLKIPTPQEKQKEVRRAQRIAQLKAKRQKQAAP